MALASSNEVLFLCDINPRAGRDEEVLKLVKETFGPQSNVHMLDEESDIYVIGENNSTTIERLSSIQANANVLDTQIEVMRSILIDKKQLRVDNVYLVFVKLEPGSTQHFVSALNLEVNKAGSGHVDLLYVGEIFSPRADVVALIATNIRAKWEIAKRVRALPGVLDSTINTFRRVNEKA